MADRYLLESGAPDGYQLEDASGVLLLEGAASDPIVPNQLPHSAPVRAFATTLRTWTVNLLQSTLAPDLSRIFRQPLRTPIFTKPAFASQAAFVATNLLVTTLAIAGASTPPGESTFPETNRTVKSFAAQLPAAPDTFDLTTLAINPFVAEEFTAPVKRRTVQQPDIELPLNQTTLAIQAPADPFKPVVFENPARRLRMQTIQDEQYFDVSAVPFMQEVWDNPTRRVRVSQPDPLQAIDRTALASPPFAQEEWPNPPRKRIKVGVQNIPAFDYAAVPFTQEDWPNPIRKRMVQQVENLPVFDRTAAPLPAPFAQTQWNTPLPRKPIQPIDLPQAIDRTPAPAPFALEDWPNPTLRLPLHEWGSVAPLQYAEFIVPPIKPFLQTEWPNPTRRVLPREWGGLAAMEFDAFVTTPLPVPPPVVDELPYGIPVKWSQIWKRPPLQFTRKATADITVLFTASVKVHKALPKKKVRTRAIISERDRQQMADAIAARMAQAARLKLQQVQADLDAARRQQQIDDDEELFTVALTFLT